MAEGSAASMPVCPHCNGTGRITCCSEDCPGSPCGACGQGRFTFTIEAAVSGPSEVRDA